MTVPEIDFAISIVDPFLNEIKICSFSRSTSCQSTVRSKRSSGTGAGVVFGAIGDCLFVGSPSGLPMGSGVKLLKSGDPLGLLKDHVSLIVVCPLGASLGLPYGVNRLWLRSFLPELRPIFFCRIVDGEKPEPRLFNSGHTSDSAGLGVSVSCECEEVVGNTAAELPTTSLYTLRLLLCPNTKQHRALCPNTFPGKHHTELPGRRTRF